MQAADETDSNASVNVQDELERPQSVNEVEERWIVDDDLQ
jgi:hypothetical protein